MVFNTSLSRFLQRTEGTLCGLLSGPGQLHADPGGHTAGSAPPCPAALAPLPRPTSPILPPCSVDIGVDLSPLVPNHLRQMGVQVALHPSGSLLLCVPYSA